MTTPCVKYNKQSRIDSFDPFRAGQSERNSDVFEFEFGADSPVHRIVGRHWGIRMNIITAIANTKSKNSLKQKQDDTSH